MAIPRNAKHQDTNKAPAVSSKAKSYWRHVLPKLALTSALALPFAASRAARADKALFAPGVCFMCPGDPKEAIASLEKVKANGYNLIEFASWPWTLPAPGSGLEKAAMAVLKWCDDNDFHFFLMMNIQYGSDGGGLDGEWTDPTKMAYCLSDWFRIMKGHRCVNGVITGNEIGPQVGNPKDSPIWWAAFIEDLKARHENIEGLNAAWKTTFADFSKVTPPKPGTPGDVDYQRFSLKAFDHYYGVIGDKIIKPALGDSMLYGPKSYGDPSIQRGCPHLTMSCWDDGVADWPQWRIKGMGDVARATGKPVFNSELHLHHDAYAFGGSPEKSRYRYFLSAIYGEWITASFAWGQWDKVAWAKEDPKILAEFRAMEPYLRAFNGPVTETHVILAGPKQADDPTMENLYTDIAGLGCAWEFICPQDIAKITTGSVYIPADTQLSTADCDAIAKLPKEVRIVFAKADALKDEYGRPVPEATMKAITARACPDYGPSHLLADDAEKLTAPYTERTEVGYLAWAPDRGHYSYPNAYPKLEAKRVKFENGWLVAVISHGPKVVGKMPWLREPSKITEITANGAVIDPAADQTFNGLSIRLFKYEPQAAAK